MMMVGVVHLRGCLNKRCDNGCDTDYGCDNDRVNDYGCDDDREDDYGRDDRVTMIAIIIKTITT